jgi:hypothetical protein
MKYWHPHLHFGQHISVSTLVFNKYKNKLYIPFNKTKLKYNTFFSNKFIYLQKNKMFWLAKPYDTVSVYFSWWRMGTFWTLGHKHVVLHLLHTRTCKCVACFNSCLWIGSSTVFSAILWTWVGTAPFSCSPK